MERKVETAERWSPSAACVPAEPCENRARSESGASGAGGGAIWPAASQTGGQPAIHHNQGASLQNWSDSRGRRACMRREPPIGCSVRCENLPIIFIAIKNKSISWPSSMSSGRDGYLCGLAALERLASARPTSVCHNS